MSARARAALDFGAGADRWVAGGSVALLGGGTLVALLAALTTSLPLAVVGGGAVALALFVLFLGGWLDGLTLLVLSLPLPALFGTDDVRLPPAAILTALVVAALGIRIALRGEKLELGALPVRGVALFAGALLLASGFALSKTAAARELVNLSSMLGLLVVTTHEIGCGRLDRARLVRLIAVAAGIAGIIAVIQSLGIIPSTFPMYGTDFFRATIGFGWPNESALYFAVAFPLCVLAFRITSDRLARVGFLAAVVACGLGLLGTFSRGSWLATLVAPLALLAVGAGRGIIRTWLLAAAAVLLVDLAAGGALSGRVSSSVVGDYAIEQRADLQYVGMLMFFDNPWVGVGPGGFGEGLEIYGPQISRLVDYIPSAHNGYIDVAATTGIIGLVGFVILLAGAFLTTASWARAAFRDPTSGTAELRTRQAVLWTLTVVPLNTITIWPFAHGTGQLIVLAVAMGVARPPALDGRSEMPAVSSGKPTQSAPVAALT